MNIGGVLLAVARWESADTSDFKLVSLLISKSILNIDIGLVSLESHS